MLEPTCPRETLGTIVVFAISPRRITRTEETMADQDADKNEVRVANDAFYKVLSAGSIEGISAACAHDADVTALHENSKEVAVGWQEVLDTWKAVPFEAFSELSVTMSDPVIKVSGSSARVVGLEKVRGKMKDGQDPHAPVSRRNAPFRNLSSRLTAHSACRHWFRGAPSVTLEAGL
jgi:ketosteroid isomerase-like protein